MPPQAFLPLFLFPTDASLNVEKRAWCCFDGRARRHARTVEQLPVNGGLRLRGSVDIGNLLQSFSGILSKVTRQLACY